MMLHFQIKVIRFTLTNILSFDEQIIEAKKGYLKLNTSQKWNHFESITLRYLLSTHNHLSLWNIAKTYGN